MQYFLHADFSAHPRRTRIFDVPALIKHEVAKGSRLKIRAFNSGPLFRAFGWTCAAAADVLYINVCLVLSLKKRHFAARHREGTLFIRAHIRVSRRAAVAEKGSRAKSDGTSGFFCRSAPAKTNSRGANKPSRAPLSLSLCLIMRLACSDDYKASFSIFAYINVCVRAAFIRARADAKIASGRARTLRKWGETRRKAAFLISLIMCLGLESGVCVSRPGDPPQILSTALPRLCWGFLPFFHGREPLTPLPPVA